MEKGENVTKEREMRGKVKNLLMTFLSAIGLMVTVTVFFQLIWRENARFEF